MADNASTDLVPSYELGEYKTNVGRENWVATWYLYRSFRYRDDRSKKRVAVHPTPFPYGYLRQTGLRE
jgi:hypothetical protein